ncbi:hypothetical protein [Bacillus sp. 1P06AnD]|uniref:hypothetical protein n=1 Tax=Bacillus sp. 1P06AnD TaxID=3132208 RepID=UPI0039A1073B
MSKGKNNPFWAFGLRKGKTKNKKDDENMIVNLKAQIQEIKEEIYKRLQGNEYITTIDQELEYQYYTGSIYYMSHCSVNDCKVLIRVDPYNMSVTAKFEKHPETGPFYLFNL